MNTDHLLQYISDNRILLIILWFLSIFFNGFTKAWAADYFASKKSNRLQKLINSVKQQEKGLFKPKS